VRDQLLNAHEFALREVQLHVGRHLLELVNELLGRRAQDVVDLVNLVELIFTGKEWVERQDFKKYAPHAPNVHFVTVVAIRHQALRRAVPPGRNVLSEGRFVVESPAAAQVCEFYCLRSQQNVLRFNVSVKNAVAVHVFYRLEQLVHIVLNFGFW